MKKLPIVTMLLAAALSGLAEPLQWVCEWPKAKAQQFELYQGEIATFEPTFRINGGAPTNLPVVTVWYQTNGMDRAWWHTDGAVFHPTNDVGAASYRFFVDAAGDGGKLYRANGTLRMLPSPGFVPNTITTPVAALDFDNIDVWNAPYYTKAETDATIEDILVAFYEEFKAATNYTDSAFEILTVEIDEAAQSATNYTDAVASSLRESVAVAASSATNYTDGVATTLRGEIAAATPEDYDTVKSNATVAAEAVAGLGDLAWIDGLEWSAIIDRPTTWAWSAISGKPTTWAWSNISDKPSWIGSSKPSYSLNEICPDSENWLGVQGNAGRHIKVLAGTVGGQIVGGLRVTASTQNDNNMTTYTYGGVAVRRNGVNTDYVFDESSDNGIVRRVELDDKADASVVTTLANKVDAIETWAIGDETALVIREAGQTNATLTVTYTNNVMYSSAVAESNTLAKAKAQTEEAIVTALEIVGEALDAKAPKAWGSLTSGGAPAPDDILVVEKKKIAVTGGGNYASIESSTGCYYVLSVSLGTEWTLESLADAQNPTNAATVTFSDADGNGVYQIVSTASRTVDAIAGVDMLAPSVRVESGNDVVTMNFPVVAAEPPTMYYKPNLTNEFAEASSSNWPGVVSSVVWSGSSGLYTATVTMVGQPGSGFFCAKYIKPGSVYVRYMKPICVPSITLDDVTYTISVETINGKKLMVLTEVN